MYERAFLAVMAEAFENAPHLAIPHLNTCIRLWADESGKRWVRIQRRKEISEKIRSEMES